MLASRSIRDSREQNKSKYRRKISNLVREASSGAQAHETEKQAKAAAKKAQASENKLQLGSSGGSRNDLKEVKSQTTAKKLAGNKTKKTTKAVKEEQEKGFLLWYCHTRTLLMVLYKQ